MTNIEYEKTDESTLKIIETPVIVPTIKTVSLDELKAKESKLESELKTVREQIAKCTELGIKTKSEVLNEEAAKKAAELRN